MHLYQSYVYLNQVRRVILQQFNCREQYDEIQSVSNNARCIDAIFRGRVLQSYEGNLHLKPHIIFKAWDFDALWGLVCLTLAICVKWNVSGILKLSGERSIQ